MTASWRAARKGIFPEVGEAEIAAVAPAIHAATMPALSGADRREGGIGNQEDLLKTIRDYRFAHRHDSASEAIRALIGYGLLAQGFVKPADGVTATPPFTGATPEILDGKLVGWSANL
jgi:hypothetical protein